MTRGFSLGDSVVDSKRDVLEKFVGNEKHNVGAEWRYSMAVGIAVIMDQQRVQDSLAAFAYLQARLHQKRFYEDLLLHLKRD